MESALDEPLVEIRSAIESDLEELSAIYNHYVRETHVTFDIEPVSLHARLEWFSHYVARGPHRLFVAHDGGGLVGFASSSRLRPKRAYETSVETSVYLAPGETGRGIGSRLYTALFAALDGEEVHRAYAGIALPNDASVALHERFDFHHIGTFTEQGRKLGRFWDVAWYEKPL